MKKLVLCTILCVAMLVPLIVVAEAFPFPLPVPRDNKESGTVEETTTAVPEPTSAPAETVAVEPTDTPIAPSEIAEKQSPDENFEDLLAGKFTLEGVPLQLPLPVEDLLSLGWQFHPQYADKTFQTIYGDEWIHFYRGDCVLTAYIRPTSEDRLAYAEAEIYRVEDSSEFSFNEQRPAKLVFPGGISLGASPEEIVAAYGEPQFTLIYEGLFAEYAEKLDAYNYGSSSSSFGIPAIFTFDLENTTVKEITLRATSYTWPTEKIDGLDVVYPSDINAYEPVDEAADNTGLLTLRLNGGAPLAFPFPTAELLKDGWQIVSCSYPFPDFEPDTSAAVSFRKGRSVLNTYVRNTSSIEAASFESCYIFCLEQGERVFCDTRILNDSCEIEIADSLRLGLPKADFLAWLETAEVSILRQTNKDEMGPGAVCSEYELRLKQKGVIVPVDIAVHEDQAIVTLIRLGESYNHFDYDELLKKAETENP